MKINTKILELSKLLLYVSSTKILDVLLEKGKHSHKKTCNLNTRLGIFKKELSIAKDIQTSFTPQLKQHLGDLDVAAGLVPSDEVCGDTINILEKSPKTYLFSIGDVCGHGIHTGILGGIVDALIYTKSDVSDIKKIMIELNKLIWDKVPKNLFVSLCLIKWDHKMKQMEYVNAGHEPMLLYNKKKNKVSILNDDGIALGIRKDITKHIHKRKIKMESGDILLLFSDGIVEAYRKDGKRYGIKHLKATFEEFTHYKKAATIKNKLLKDLNQFVDKENLDDDATVLVIKRK